MPTPAAPAESKAVAVRVPSKQAAIATSLRESLLPRLPDLLPEGASVDRFIALTMQAMAKSPELYECDPSSVLMSALEVAQVGLEPTGSIGGAHLVPFREKDGKKRAQVIYDYRGIQHLIRQGGGGEVKAVLVYEGDEFKVYEGTNPRIEHEPAYKTNDPTKIQFVYAWPIDHPEKFEVMTKEAIDLIRASSRLKNGIPWTQHYGQQARKTAIRRIGNYLDLRPATRAIIERDIEWEFGGEVGRPAETRASRVKERLAARKAATAPQEAGAPVPAPEGSAGQQTDVCGSQGPQDATCVGDPDHEPPCANADGTVTWPKEEAK